jgi:hypothetical protein
MLSTLKERLSLGIVLETRDRLQKGLENQNWELKREDENFDNAIVER